MQRAVPIALLQSPGQARELAQPTVSEFPSPFSLMFHYLQMPLSIQAIMSKLAVDHSLHRLKDGLTERIPWQKSWML